jgi:hypothetical protein
LPFRVGHLGFDYSMNAVSAYDAGEGESDSEVWVIAADGDSTGVNYADPWKTGNF